MYDCYYVNLASFEVRIDSIQRYFPLSNFVCVMLIIILESIFPILCLHRALFVHFRWSPTYDVSAILTSIQSLLSDPNPNSPANSLAAQLFKENRREYEKRVKACVEQSWCDD